MATSLEMQIALKLAGAIVSTLDVGAATYPVNYGASYNFAEGTGANQANKVFIDTRTLTASSSEDLDFVGSLVDPFGTTLSFDKIKALIVVASSANVNDVLVGGASATQLVALFGDATDVVKVKPGGLVAFIAPDATGYDISSSTDLLKIANSSSGSSVTYTVIVVGVV